MPELPFAIVPVEVAMDDRLSKGELKVLIALLSFRNRNTNLCCPKRESICLRTGYSISMITRMTNKLVEHGWLEKTGKGAFGKSSQYVITVPEDATAAIVAATATPGVATAATPIVAATATHNKQTIKQTKVTDNSANDFARWYADYPIKKSRKRAEEAWEKADKPPLQTMLDILNMQKTNDRQWIEGFAPQPTTYLNQERWNDELEHGRKQETVSDEYAARVAREDAILSKLHGGAVVNNGQVVPSGMDEAERRIGFTPVPGLDG